MALLSALPTSQKAWTLQLPKVNWPQQGCRQAGKEKHRLEDLLHMSTCSQLGGQWELGQHCSRCSTGLDAACVHGQQSTSVLLTVEPRGTPVLCCAS